LTLSRGFGRTEMLLLTAVFFTYFHFSSFPEIMVVVLFVVLVWFVVENDVFFRRRQNHPHHETGLEARFTITIIIIMITSSLPRFTTSLHHEWG